MTAMEGTRDAWIGPRSFLVAGCLLLTVCAGPPAETRWVKAGIDGATASREANDCRAQANQALSVQQGINQDRSATLGRNWALSSTTAIHDQTMQQQVAAIADQAFSSCMRAKGFTKAG
jgi:hypothetical protein